MSDQQAHAIIEPAATRVRDPRSGRSVWMAQLVKDASLDGETLRFTLEGQGHSAEELERMEQSLQRNLRGMGFAGQLDIRVEAGAPAAAAAPADDHGHSHSHGHSHNHAPAAPKAAAAPKKDPVQGMSGPGMQPHGGPIEKKRIPGVKRIIAVASGKGGVGKSTVSTNLAVALSKAGWRVGIMDADIYGPSVPLMMNISGKPFANDDKLILPLESYGIPCMSIGLLVDDKTPIIWRGPMVMGVVNQFLHQVAWGELDALIIDLPPGTGDAQLTMIQAVEITGAVVVTTPQQVAVLDAVRAIEMFKKLDVPVLGIVENMAWLDLPGGGRMHPFGEGGGVRTAKEYGVPLLAQVPLDPSIREGGDGGRPAALGKGAPADAFAKVGKGVIEALAGT